MAERPAVPALRRHGLAPGDVAVANNLAHHEVAAARVTLETRGASLLFLPAGSPAPNPVTHVFATLKQSLRSAAPAPDAAPPAQAIG